jgi:hypothetical protein
MTVAVANVSLANTFGHWVARTNELAAAMSLKAVTVNSNAAVGNAAINGTFSANTIRLDRVTGLTGANVSIDSAVLIIANTASVNQIGQLNINGRMVVNAVSTIQIAGSNATHRVLSVIDGNNTMGFIKVEFPLDQLTDVDTTNIATKDAETIIKWNPTLGQWQANTMSLINTTRINTLNVGTISSVLTVQANANIGNTTLFVNMGSKRVGVGTNAPRAALDVSGTIMATGDVSSFNTSDEKFKMDGYRVDTSWALEKLNQVIVRGWTWDERALEESEFADPYLRGEDHGVFAGELEKSFPQFVQIRPDGTKAVDYRKFIPYLLASVQELSTRQTETDGKLKELSSRET